MFMQPSPAAPRVETRRVEAAEQPVASTSQLPDDAITSMPPGEPSLFSKYMAENPYFSAGAGLMGIGVALTVARRSLSLAANLAQRRLLVTLEIPSKDKAYPWFLEWMAAQTATAPPKSSLRSLLRGESPMMQLKSHELAVETSYTQHPNGSSSAEFNLVPGPGTHYFRFKGAWMRIVRERDAKLMDLHSGTPWETVVLTTLSKDRELFKDLLREAREWSERETEGKTVVYTAWGVEWRPFGKPRRRREMGSVVLGEGVSERIEKDLRSFLGRGRWYADRGIPYRRGYLLHGPPGSGKTSFIQALAGALSYNICLLNLSERGLTDDKLNHLLGLVPERSFILLEDVDSAFNKRVQTSEDGYKSSVTFSGLLNALDGVASSEERIIFMTTNHYERLDPALIRPGRVDLKEFLGDAAPEQARRLFVRFYGRSEHRGIKKTTEEGVEIKTGLAGVGEELEETEVQALGDEVERILQQQAAVGRTVSMASLQGHFIRHGARESVADIVGLCNERVPNEEQ